MYFIDQMLIFTFQHKLKVMYTVLRNNPNDHLKQYVLVPLSLVALELALQFQMILLDKPRDLKSIFQVCLHPV